MCDFDRVSWIIGTFIWFVYGYSCGRTDGALAEQRRRENEVAKHRRLYK